MADYNFANTKVRTEPSSQLTNAAEYQVNEPRDRVAKVVGRLSISSAVTSTQPHAGQQARSLVFRI